MEKIRIAICYDFDKTLSLCDMQSYGFSKNINMDINDFWDYCTEFELGHSCDRILAYMHQMIAKCKEQNIKPTREFFKSCAGDIEYFEGVETWFERINKFAESKGIELEHYIISSGLKEMIEGTPIAKYFKEIYACEFCYDKNGEAFWPAIAINYTNKTQFLYRINKGVFNVCDNSVNNFTPHDERYVAFDNIIYIGDSSTDIPSMKLIRSKNGCAIGVYHTISEYYKNLIHQNRVDYIAQADYRENSELDLIVKEVIETMYHKNKLRLINKKQKSI